MIRRAYVRVLVPFRYILRMYAGVYQKYGVSRMKNGICKYELKYGPRECTECDSHDRITIYSTPCYLNLALFIHTLDKLNIEICPVGLRSKYRPGFIAYEILIGDDR